LADPEALAKREAELAAAESGEKAMSAVESKEEEETDVELRGGFDDFFG
jgi:hypothetical protein